MAASPVCASFSTAITPAWRNREYPAGRPGLTPEQQCKVDLGQAQLEFVLRLCELCLDNKVLFWVENPDGSWFWKQCDELSWDKLFEQSGGKLGDLWLDQCRFGTRWRKRTKFRTTCHLAGQRIMCQCDAPHVVLRGRCKQAGQNSTKLAESYPRRLCAYLAGAFAIDLGYCGKRRKLDINSCARCSASRIGEASNPGPRGRQPRLGRSIYDFNLLEPSAVLMRAKFWDQFSSWVQAEMGLGAIDHFILQPGLLVAALEAFGAYSFSTGWPLHYFRQL